MPILPIFSARRKIFPLPGPLFQATRIHALRPTLVFNRQRVLPARQGYLELPLLAFAGDGQGLSQQWKTRGRYDDVRHLLEILSRILLMATSIFRGLFKNVETLAWPQTRSTVCCTLNPTSIHSKPQEELLPSPGGSLRPFTGNPSELFA